MRTLLLLLSLISVLLMPGMSDAKVKPKTVPKRQPSYVYGSPSATDDPGYLKGTNIPWRTTAPASN
jgi:hypothetical protein